MPRRGAGRHGARCGGSVSRALTLMDAYRIPVLALLALLAQPIPTRRCERLSYNCAKDGGDERSAQRRNVRSALRCRRHFL